MAKTKSGNTASSHGEHMSLSIRKIANGYVVTHSKDGPGGYKTTETFHDKKPSLNLAAIKQAASSKPQPRDS